MPRWKCSISMLLLVGLVYSGQSGWSKSLRPLETEDANTLPKGQIDLKISIEYREDYVAPFTPGNLKGDYYELPKFAVAMGVSDNVEIQLDWTLIKLDSAQFDEYGAGDPRIFTKINLLEEDGNRPAVGFRFGVKIPSADIDKGLGTDNADFFISGLASKEIGPVTAHLNLGLGILGDPRVNAGQDDVLLYAIGLVAPLSDEFSVSGEIIGQALSNADNDRSLARLGLAYHRGDFTLDGSIAAGLTNKTEDFRFGIGLTYHWQAF